MNQTQASGDPHNGSSPSIDLAVIAPVDDTPNTVDGSTTTVVLAAPTHTGESFTLSSRAAERIRRSVPEETRRAYASDWARFAAFAAAMGQPALGCSADLLAEYATVLADAGKAPATIERALASIAAAHRASGLPVPITTLARAVLRDHKQQLAGNGWSVAKSAAVTITVLRALVAGVTQPYRGLGEDQVSLGMRTLMHSTLDAPFPVADRQVRELLRPIQLRDRLVLVLGFAMGARRSELAALNLADVTVTTAGLEVRVRKSKTDQEAAGRIVAIPRGQNPATCPVLAFEAWRDCLAAHGITAGPLLVRIDRHGKLRHVATGRGSADGRLTGQAITIIVNRAARAASLDPKLCWSGHSLRRGFATEAYRASGDLLRIARHGGWADGSKVLLGYVEDVDRWQANPLVGVGL